MSAAAEKFKKSTVPGLILAISKVRAPAKAAAAVRRLTGRRGLVEVFVAFDDPSSALALVELDRRLARRKVDLVVRPVLNRDLAGDPAIEAKRAYAVTDTQRLARRYDLVLARTEPLPGNELAFLGEWVAACQPADGRQFAVAAANRIWFEPEASIDRASMAELLTQSVGSPPPVSGAEAVKANEKIAKRKLVYTVPMASVHGRLFFAHERLDQIGEELDLLGWKAR
jgi:2-hydroxychromene-2-carboxylate isomerase